MDKLMVKPLLDMPLSNEEVYNFAKSATGKDCVAQTIACQLLDTMRENERLRHSASMLAYDGLSPKQRHRIASDILIPHPNKHTDRLTQDCERCGRSLIVEHAKNTPTRIIEFHCPCGHSTKTSGGE